MTNLEHRWDRHSYWTTHPNVSKFSKEFSSPEKIKELLADGLGSSGEFLRGGSSA